LILEAILALVFVISFSVSFKFVRRRARLEFGLLASLITGLFSTLFVLILTFLQSHNWKFYLGLVEIIFVVIVCVVEFLLRLNYRIEVNLGPADDYLKKVSKGLQIRAAAFFYSFDQVSGLDSAMADKYLTKDFWEELTIYRTNGMFERGKDREILGNKDISGKYINVLNGMRVTPNQPASAEKKILLFGGSNIITYEAQDDKTPSAFLQNQIIKIGLSFKVENHGVGAASIADCMKRLRLTDISQNDIIVFLFGINDVGINLPSKLVGKGLFRKIPFWCEATSLLRDRSRIVDWLYLKTVAQVFTDLKANPEILNSTITTCYEIVNFLKSKNIEFFFILQPNLYTKKTKNVFENWLRESYPKHWENVVLTGYTVLQKEFSEDKNFEMAIDIFDWHHVPCYLDWAHVNSLGNEIIAQRILNLLLDRGMLVSEAIQNS